MNDDKIELNYCFTCKKSFHNYGNLNRHFKTTRHKTTTINFLTENAGKKGWENF